MNADALRVECAYSLEMPSERFDGYRINGLTASVKTSPANPHISTESSQTLASVNGCTRKRTMRNSEQTCQHKVAVQEKRVFSKGAFCSPYQFHFVVESQDMVVEQDGHSDS